MKKQKSKDVLISLSNKALFNLKTDILINLPYLSRAVYLLKFSPSFMTKTWGSDGDNVYFNPSYILENYLNNKPSLIRGFMQILIHCIFCHMYRESEYENKELYWICSDICAEKIIDGIDNKTIYRLSSDFRDRVYEELDSKIYLLTPDRLYKYYEEKKIEYAEYLKLEKEFLKDDHQFWKDSKKKNPNEGSDIPREDQWKSVGDKLLDELIQGRDASSHAGSIERILRAEFKSKTDYKELLRKYMVYREELRIDPDSFDYGLYMYGLDTYGNLPLIEENEYLETKKIEDLVIAIDTSASCQGDLVRRFLNETCSILQNSEIFFKNSNIVIIECDNKVQKVIRLKSPKEIEDYANAFSIVGGFGTDFRPVFNEIFKMQKTGELQSLKALIYFTDGFGEYPKLAPNFETSFVLFKDGAIEEDKIPHWAGRYIFEGE